MKLNDVFQNAGKNICVDFDGVLHEYRVSGTKKDLNKILDPPVQEARTWCWAVSFHGYHLYCLTSRALTVPGKRAVEAWLIKEDFPPMIVTALKIPAILYIDDRAFHFSGSNFPEIKEIKNFKPWNR